MKTKDHIDVPAPEGGYADVYDPPGIKDYVPEIVLLLGIVGYFIHKALSNG